MCGIAGIAGRSKSAGLAAAEKQIVDALAHRGPDLVEVQKLWRRYLANPGAVGWSRIWSLFVLARWCQVMRVGI
jgi:asparagine synthetase B (glutamine-hydrolysing)